MDSPVADTHPIWRNEGFVAYIVFRRSIDATAKKKEQLTRTRDSAVATGANPPRGPFVSGAARRAVLCRGDDG